LVPLASSRRQGKLRRALAPKVSDKLQISRLPCTPLLPFALRRPPETAPQIAGDMNLKEGRTRSAGKIMEKQKLEDLRDRVPCAALLEQGGFAIDVKESNRKALKYRRGAEIVIVIHGGRDGSIRCRRERRCLRPRRASGWPSHNQHAKNSQSAHVNRSDFVGCGSSPLKSGVAAKRRTTALRLILTVPGQNESSRKRPSIPDMASAPLRSIS